jgi:hypothetical protein
VRVHALITGEGIFNNYCKEVFYLFFVVNNKSFKM